MSTRYQQGVRTGTARADTAINKMKTSNNKYMTSNFIKGTLPYSHIKSIDFLQDRSDGSSTIQTLNCIVFQLHMSKSSDIPELDLPKHCTIKCLQPSISRSLENFL